MRESTRMASRAVRLVLQQAEPRSREELIAPDRLRSELDRRVAGEREEDREGSSPGPALDLWDVRQLPLQQRAVVLLVFWGDCSIKDVGSVLKSTTPGVKGLLKRAKAELRRRATGAAAISDTRRPS